MSGRLNLTEELKKTVGRNISTLHRPVLVINSSYEPINICGVKRAVILLIKGRACLEAASSKTIKSFTTEMSVPAVIRVNYFVKIPFRIRPFSKKNLFFRDQYTCQYCGKEHETPDLTLDHVIPRSKGGESTWENTVTCCRKCNVTKGNHLPGEINMYPRKNPRAPLFISTLRLARIPLELKDHWQRYLYY